MPRKLKKMDKSILLETIGDTIENRIVDFLIEGRGMDYSKTDIADNCEISRPALYRVLPKLVKEGMVKPTRAIGRVQLFSLNSENAKVEALLKLEGYLLTKSFDEMKVKT